MILLCYSYYWFRFVFNSIWNLPERKQLLQFSCSSINFRTSRQHCSFSYKEWYVKLWVNLHGGMLPWTSQIKGGIFLFLSIYFLLILQYFEKSIKTMPLEPQLMTTLLLRPYSFSLNIKITESYIILKTLLMGPPHYYNQDSMAYRWLHFSGSTVFFFFFFFL